MADFAVGVTACLAFWRDLAFKAAAVCAASIFLLGDAVGHIRQMMVAGNFAPGNGRDHDKYRTTSLDVPLFDDGMKTMLDTVTTGLWQ
jgi:hypothetical protein